MYALTFSGMELLAYVDGDAGIGVLLQHVLAAVVFAVVGIIVFAVGMWIITRVLPFSLRKELQEDQNTAIAVIVGAMLIGISMIIAAAIQG